MVRTQLVKAVISQPALREDLGSEVQAHGDPWNRSMNKLTGGKQLRGLLVQREKMGRIALSSDQYLKIKANFAPTLKLPDNINQDNKPTFMKLDCGECPWILKDN